MSWEISSEPISVVVARGRGCSLHAARRVFLADAACRPDDPRTIAAGASAGDAVLLLADVLRRADQRAGDFEQSADAARIAGLDC